ncbi:MAG: adenylosuccinate synthetase, partial [Proteobacteria bacterium]|nr:adenylosuccinate synthetase [Pseudomonadota bacterium]
VLDGLDVIRMCVGYRIAGGEISLEPPLLADHYGDCEPVYEDMPGWKDSTVGVTDYNRLPLAARNYLERMQALVGVPLDIVSTGADREHTIIRRHPFD